MMLALDGHRSVSLVSTRFTRVDRRPIPRLDRAMRYAAVVVQLARHHHDLEHDAPDDQVLRRACTVPGLIRR